MSENLKASRILHEMQEAGRIQMENDKPSVDDLLDRNLALMVNRIDMVVSRAASDDEEIAYSSNACPSERATLLRVYNAMAGEEQFAYASSIWSILGTDGPKMSQSSRPTFIPILAKATARLTATVLLPTPPLPLETAMMFFTPGKRSGRSGRGACRVFVLISTSASLQA